MADIRTFQQKPPLVRALQRTGSNDTDIVEFAEELFNGDISFGFDPDGTDPDWFTDIEHPRVYGMGLPVGSWVVATGSGIVSLTDAQLRTAYFEIPHAV
ncbi:hypothetical protein O5Y58_14070 [Microbacterium paraoxydans]|uniref:hypothetical protein n=1 Tax=Microbacterium paraoxydans TaxID=199592 RepID=UPI00352C2143